MEATQRQEILELYEGLRVTDVNDGLDAVGLQNIFCMSRDIRPVWKDFVQFKHRIYGFALTVRYLPAESVIHASSIEEYDRIKQDWYSQLSPNLFSSKIQKGDIIVIDGATLTDVGFTGSGNTFGWINKGAGGVVTNGGARDTDELTIQQLPVYSAYIGRGVKPGRLVTDAVNVPVNVGGVLVRPGDFIVADGDGVVVVPQAHILEVGRYARKEREIDKRNRRRHYEQAGLPLDFTVI